MKAFRKNNKVETTIEYTDYYFILSREYHWTLEQMREMYDDEFWLAIDTAFKLIGCQAGMGAVGYDFRTQSQREKDDWFAADSKVLSD